MNLKITGILILSLSLAACAKGGDNEAADVSSTEMPGAVVENNNVQIVDPGPSQTTTAPAQPVTVQATEPQVVSAPPPTAKPVVAPAVKADDIHVTFVDSSQLPVQAPVQKAVANPVDDTTSPELFSKAELEPPRQPPRATPPSEEIPLPRARPATAPRTAAPRVESTLGLNTLEKELLSLLNASRAQAGIPPLKFSREQSNGTGRCIGSEGHSAHMAQTNNMSHDQFPADICIRTLASGENVGYSTGPEDHAIRTVHKIMMDEGPSGGHYQNIMSDKYNTVGLGFSYVNGVLWITENFLRL